MADICESLQDRELRQAKGAVKPEPKGERPGSEADASSDADAEPSVHGRSLSHPKGIYAERGKPDCLRENGNRIARGGDRQAGMGFRRKRMPCRNRADTG